MAPFEASNEVITAIEHEALRNALGKLRQQQTDSPYGRVPASVPHLQDLVSNTLVEEDRAVLYSLLLSEVSRARNSELYIACLRQRALDLPSDPLSSSGLAYELAIARPELRQEIIDVGLKAVDLAKSHGLQLRYCLTNLARIALVLDEYALLTKALTLLVADAKNEEREDSPYEFDFVDKIDPFRIDEKLLSAYKSLA